jgi:hypothetical protein
MRRSGALRLAFCLLCLLVTASARAQTWEPGRSWAFVVGVLEWKDSATFGSFPKKERRDAKLVDLLKQRGVAADRIVYLQDRAATTAAVRASLDKFLSRTRPGDTLLVYYCGHGYREDDGTLFFATYDAGNRTPGWRAADLVATIEARFRGDRALLTGDCCYSGGLAQIVQQRPRRISYACLASSLASQASTGAWTFTEALLDSLNGKPYVDSDRDGMVTFAEMGRHIREEMVFGDDQRATTWAGSGFGEGMSFATAPALSHPRLGERVMARSGGKTGKGKIVGVQNGKFRIHYYGWDDADDEWLTVAALSPPNAPKSRFIVGQTVEVEWKGKWWKAKVQRVGDGLYFIRYDGYDASWDEWVGQRRIRVRKG